MDRVTAGAGAGKVSMQDFHFVMRNNSSSPGLLAGTQKPDPTGNPK
jgi:type VI protein secretion system component Hcp